MRLAGMALMSRSLRVDARSIGTYLARAALVVIILFWLYLGQQSAGTVGAPGLVLFGWVLGLNFVFITLAGISHFASAITEEKEEQTLGLLKMTGLNSVTILLGKSTSRLVSAILLVLVQMPFTLLAITLGGVSLDQVVAGYVSLLAYLVFVANLALLCSVICDRSPAAGSLTTCLLLLYFIGPVATSAVVSGLIAAGYLSSADLAVSALLKVTDFLYRTSVIPQLLGIASPAFATSPLSVQVWTNLAFGAGLFLLAWLAFDPFTRHDKPAAPPRGLTFKPKSPLRRLGARRAWAAALEWKDFYFLAGGVNGMIVKVLLLSAVIGFFVWVQTYFDQLDVEVLGGMIIGVSLATLALEVILLAGRIFNEEVKWKTLSALMSLPFSPAQIAYRKVAGASITLLPTLGFFVIGVFLVGDDFFDGLGEILSHPAGWLFCIVLPIFMAHFVAYLSLAVKWGALALALGLTAVPLVTVLICGGVMFGDEEAFFSVLCLTFLGLSVVLHIAMAGRLRTLAAE